MRRNKTETVGVVELRMRFAQQRANHFKAMVAALNLRIEKLSKRQSDLADKAHRHSEHAAGLRGLVSIAREKGCDRMRVENGYVTFLNGSEVK